MTKTNMYRASYNNEYDVFKSVEGVMRQEIARFSTEILESMINNKASIIIHTVQNYVDKHSTGEYYIKQFVFPKEYDIERDVLEWVTLHLGEVMESHPDFKLQGR